MGFIAATFWDGKASVDFHELTLVAPQFGSLEGLNFEEWIEFLWYFITLLLGDFQEASSVGTSLDKDLSRWSYRPRIIWDLGIISSFSLILIVDSKASLALLEDKQSLGRVDCNVPIFDVLFWISLVLTHYF